MNSSVSQKICVPIAFRLGCLTGLLAGCGPAFLCGLAFNCLVHMLRHWILGWDGPDAELTIGGLLGGTTLKVSLDLQDHLNVTSFMKTLKALESGWWWTIPILTLLLTLLGGALLATLAGVGASLYNVFDRRNWLVFQPVRRANQLTNSPTHQPTAWLALVADSTRRWPMRPGLTRVGSDPISEVPLLGGVPRHAEIRHEEGRYVLYDLSSGQTWVQGRPVVGRHWLKDGFRVRFGDIEMIFQSE